MENQNVTLSIPKGVLRKAKILATRKGKSLSNLLTQTLKELVATRKGIRWLTKVIEIYWKVESI